MEEEVKVIDHYLCIQMPREVDHHHAIKIRETADKLLLQNEVENIVFDFEKTVFMDSSGVGIILGRLKKMQGLGGKVYVIHVSQRLMKILQISGVMKYVEVLGKQELV